MMQLALASLVPPQPTLYPTDPLASLLRAIVAGMAMRRAQQRASQEQLFSLMLQSDPLRLNMILQSPTLKEHFKRVGKLRDEDLQMLEQASSQWMSVLQSLLGAMTKPPTPSPTLPAPNAPLTPVFPAPELRGMALPSFVPPTGMGWTPSLLARLFPFVLF